MKLPSPYSDPALWEVSKRKARDQLGGHSARAMQLAGKIYRAAGGKYLGKRTKAQKSLAKWTGEDWTTKSGKPSRQTGERYLPRKVIEGLTPAEYGATTRAKRKGTAAGQQFVKQPKRIAAKVSALKDNPMKKPTPAQLAARAKFAEMARSGAFKRKAAAAKKAARKTTSAATYSVVSRDGAVEAKGLTLAAARKFIADKAKRTKRFAGYWSAVKTNPAKKTVSEKISQLTREGYPQKQAIAVALSEQRAGKVKRNPATGRKGSGTKLNPMAPAARSSSTSNWMYSVEAKRMLGSAGSVFEPLAGFQTKAQAQDYAKAILASHPGIILRIKTYA